MRESRSGIPLDLGGLFSGQKLYESLSQHVDPAEGSVVLDSIRDYLLSGNTDPDAKVLHQLCKNCHKCSSFAPDPQLPSWNIADPDVIFVADNPNMAPEAIDFFIKSLRAGSYDSSRIMLTYINRCPQRSFTDEEVSNCIGYLISEIEILRPKLIVTLGLSAYQNLLDDHDAKLGSKQGSVLWVGPWAILPTYSPFYAIKASKQDSFVADIKQSHHFVYGN